jgi:glycosyl transferase family 25
VNPPKADPSSSASARGTQWPIFVLSLEGDEARRAPLLNSLAEMGLEAEVLIGVDGRGGLPDWAEAEVDRETAWTWDNNKSFGHLTDGELACALSHILAYRKIIDEGLPGAIIFEDDALVIAAFKDFVDQRGYEAGAMVLLGHRNTHVNPFSKRQLCDGIFGHRLLNSPIYAHGYTVSRAAAKYILTAASPVRARADWPCHIYRLKALAADPQIAFQPEDRLVKSHLEAGRCASRQNIKRQKNPLRYLTLAYWARVLRKRLGRRIA